MFNLHKSLIVILLLSLMSSCTSIKTNKNHNTSSAEKLCLWLLPDSNSKKLLDQVMIEIQNKTNEPYFQPHVTLFCGTTTNIKSLKENLKRTFDDEKIIHATIDPAKEGYKFFKKLYYPLNMNNQLYQANIKAKKLDPNSEYIFMPHISLFYGQSLPTEILDIAKNYKLNTQNISFDKIRIIKDCSVENYSCIEKWENLFEISFGTIHK